MEMRCHGENEQQLAALWSSERLTGDEFMVLSSLPVGWHVQVLDCA